MKKINEFIAKKKNSDYLFNFIYTENVNLDNFFSFKFSKTFKGVYSTDKQYTILKMLFKFGNESFSISVHYTGLKILLAWNKQNFLFVMNKSRWNRDIKKISRSCKFKFENQQIENSWKLFLFFQTRTIYVK